MNHKIIPEKKKLTVRFIEKRGKKGKINKSVICHIGHYLSLYYGKLEVCECSNGEHAKHIDLILTVVSKKSEKEREILKDAEIFLKDFFRSHAGNVCNCNKCYQKRRPAFCQHNSHNKSVA